MQESSHYLSLWGEEDRSVEITEQRVIKFFTNEEVQVANSI